MCGWQRAKQHIRVALLLNALEASEGSGDVETLELRLAASAGGSCQEVKFERRSGHCKWRAVAPVPNLPAEVCICADEHVPIRTAKNHTVFRHSVLTQMLRVQRILSNLVLFKCTRCKSRFPTFHPLHKPWFALESTKRCSIEVASWDSQPPDSTRVLATFHTGVCQVCARSLQCVEGDDILRDVCTYGPENSWGPLNNIDDVRFPFGRDIGGVDRGKLYLKELQYCHENATVTESMFVALEHMQVVCCYLRSSRSGASSMSGFRKNIISFPQDLTEMKQLQNFFSNLQIHDVVNVVLPEDATRSCAPSRGEKLRA